MPPSSPKINYMKKVKTFAALLLLTGFLSTAAIAQDSKMDKKAEEMDSKMDKMDSKMDKKMDKMDSKMDKMDDKMAMKEHKCTKACKDGKHVYAHGEKGHVCTDACKKMEKKAKA